MAGQGKKYKIIFFIGFFFLAGLLLAYFLRGHNFALLNPKGIVAQKERSLMFTAMLLMLMAVVPAFVMLGWFIFKFRAGNKKSNYAPNLDNNLIAGLIWLIPGVVIFIIAGLIWKSTHELDPYKKIISSVKPLTIQVVALQWKWLFIYPEQNIASVNFVQLPKDTPINFELTADAPMNTFWIPQLGGQVYAMAGMQTQLHLMANEVGEFIGQSSEISGRGYSGMKFIVQASSQADFETWIKNIKKSTQPLTSDEYKKLIKPSENNSQVFYSAVEKDLFNNVTMKYMMPDHEMAE